MMNYFKLPLTHNYSVEGIATRRPNNSMIKEANIEVPAFAMVLVFALIPKLENQIVWKDLTKGEVSLSDVLENIQDGNLKFASIVDNREERINTYLAPDFIFTEWVVKAASSFVEMCESIMNENDVDIRGLDFSEELFKEVLSSFSDNVARVDACIMFTEQGIPAKQQVQLIKELESSSPAN